MCRPRLVMRRSDRLVEVLADGLTSVELVTPEIVSLAAIPSLADVRPRHTTRRHLQPLVRRYDLIATLKGER